MKIYSCTWLLLLLVTLGHIVAQASHSQIIDITHTIENNMPVFGKNTGSGQLIIPGINTFTVTGSITNLGTHYGTHVDSPVHIKSLIPLGIDASSLDLQVLIGPVLVVKVPEDKNITAEVLSSLNLPGDVSRVIFKTANTDRHLMQHKAFAANYTGFTTDGAEWLVKNTQIKLVGIDYMSIATRDNVVPVHQILLNNTGIIPVECLKLDRVNPGQYNVYCLPLKVKAEASPARCILMK